jgi:hypothetical protein
MNDTQEDPQVYLDQIFLQAAQRAREVVIEGLVRLGLQQDTIELGERTERSKRKRSTRRPAVWCIVRTLAPQEDGENSSMGYRTTITFQQRNCQSPTSPLDLVDCRIESEMPISAYLNELQKRRGGQFDYVQICQRVRQLGAAQQREIQERRQRMVQQELHQQAGDAMLSRLGETLAVPKRDRGTRFDYWWGEYLPGLDVTLDDSTMVQEHRIEFSLSDNHAGKRLSLEGLATLTRRLRDQLPRETEPACAFLYDRFNLKFKALTEAQALAVIQALREIYDLFYPKSEEE